MKIMVFSDSHGSCGTMEREIKKMKDIVTLNYIIHLGDLLRDAEYLRNKFHDIPVLSVAGNCDYVYEANEQEKTADIGGKRFFLLHGHTKRVKYTCEIMKNAALQKNCDIILYGHTHEPREDYSDGIYIVNPGSISEDRSGRGNSYCVIDIQNGVLCPNIVFVQEISGKVNKVYEV
jgi:putative phosphoesterase